MADNKFSKVDAIKFGWEKFKGNIGFLLLVTLISVFVSVSPNLISFFVKTANPMTSIITSITSIALSILSIVVTMGIVKISIGFCDNKENKLSDIFSCYGLIFKELGAVFFYALPFFLFGIAVFGLFGIAKMGGSNSLLLNFSFLGIFLLGTFGGSWWIVKMFFFIHAIVDNGSGPIECLKKSAAITNGVKWDLFVFSLMVAGINLLGGLCFLVGLLVTMPVSYISVAFVYRKLSEDTVGIKMHQNLAPA